VEGRYSAGMATCIPPNATISTWFENAEKKRQLQEDNQRLQRETRWRDWNVTRGPRD